MNKFDFQISRRQFMKAALFASITFALGGDVFAPEQSFSSGQGLSLSPEEFKLQEFLEWYKGNGLYRGDNPNLKSHQGIMHTFEAAYSHGWTPGIAFTVPSGTEMVAVDDGYVHKIQRLDGGFERAGGMMVTVEHPSYTAGYPSRMYQSYYAHLDEGVADYGPVKRGYRIGTVTQYCDKAKLMFKVGGNWVNPDNYGPHHGFMDYQDGPMETLPKKEMEFRYLVQAMALNDLDSFRVGHDKQFLANLWHEKGVYGEAQLSNAEKFRLLEKLYTLNPKLFPGLGQQQFEQLQNKFYSNQPIVLTLPIKRPSS